MENNEIIQEILNAAENQQRTINILNDKINTLDRKNLQQRNEIVELIKLVNSMIGSLNNISSYISGESKLNKEKTEYEMKIALKDGFSGILKDSKRNPKLIVSLTSFPDRMYDIKYCLFSLLNQSLKPDMVVLWLGEEQFPNKEEDISEEILDLKKFGLTIKWCKDIKSYKKLIPALKEFPQDIIVTADDDLYYPREWLEGLYSEYQKNNDLIHCKRCHRVKLKDSSISPYSEWDKNISHCEPSALNFFTGAGGVLYPPYSQNTFYGDISDENLFMSLCPTADDIWFWAMCILNNKKINIIDNSKQIVYINPERERGMLEDKTLWQTNSQGGNDAAIKNIIEKYPQIIDILMK